ncbi:unnamed protein product [Haemonchus placei]|uniref:Ovule protein n=1 Tax=Haemonchus placei TaxID=6290 RepID=A0A0N4WWD8_HAEPC|nr:unnamed protein product [Haemonchus placei]
MEQYKVPHLCYKRNRGTGSRRPLYRDLLRHRSLLQAGLLPDCIHTLRQSKSSNKVQLHNQSCRSIAMPTGCIYLKTCSCSW